jgi:predicted Zn-dependent protease
MAERIEEPEVQSEQTVEPISAAAAIAIGVRKGRTRERTDPEFDAFLRDQRRLINIQTEHLHEQREVILARLRLGRWKDRVSLALQGVTALIGLAIAGAVGAMAWQAHEDHGVRIEAFSVAPDLAQRGLTGQVVASELLDKLAALQAKTVTARPANSYANDWGGDIKVEIPETGVSIGELNRYLREWLGSQTRISGEVVRTPTGLSFTARAGANPGATFQGSDTELDKLTQQAAESIYAQTQPYRWAVYLSYSAGRTGEGLAEYRRLAGSGPKEDRAWAYTGWSQFAGERGQLSRALETAQQALAIDPELESARLALIRALNPLGRQQEALEAERRLAADLQAGRTKGVPDREAAEEARTAAGSYALMRSDYQSAAQLLTQQWRTSEGRAWDARGSGVLPLYLDHDVGGARRLASAAGESGPGLGLTDSVAREDWRDAAAQADTWRASPGMQRSLALMPGTAATFAWPYAHAGRLAEAEALLSWTPRDCYRCLITRGLVASLQHDWPSADRWYAEAARQGPSIPLAQTTWGQSLLDRGDVDGAIAKLNDAHRIQPRFADPLELWGEALLRKGDNAGAVAKFAEADKYAPRWGRNHLRWGEALMLSGRYHDARAQYEAANGLDLGKPDRAALDVLLARTSKGALHG